MSRAPTPRQVQGSAAEAAAQSLLEASGLRLVARNFRCRHGEIDLVMLDGAMLVFVEVRARMGSMGADAVASVGPAKRTRLLRAASEFLAAHPGHARRACRFDVVGFQGGTEPHDRTWLRGAFEVC